MERYQFDAGFPREAVTVKTQPLKSGIVRDSIDQSHPGYSALVAGRTGLGKIVEIRMGSVASKLIEVAGHQSRPKMPGSGGVFG